MRPLVATVDLTALRHNYLLAKQCAPQRKAFAVVRPTPMAMVRQRR